MPVVPVAAAPPPTPPAAPRAAFPTLPEPRPLSPPPAPAAAPSPALAALDRIERAQRRLDAVLAEARAGRTFTAAELIGLQAQAYAYAQTVDLASKLVEQGAQSVRQAVNTQL